MSAVVLLTLCVASDRIAPALSLANPVTLCGLSRSQPTRALRRYDDLRTGGGEFGDNLDICGGIGDHEIQLIDGREGAERVSADPARDHRHDPPPCRQQHRSFGGRLFRVGRRQAMSRSEAVDADNRKINSQRAEPPTGPGINGSRR